MKTKKITNHNFKLWWDSLEPATKYSIIYFLLIEKEDPNNPKEMTLLIKEIENIIETPLDEVLIEKIKSIKNYSFSSINDYKNIFNFRNIKYLESLKILKLIDTNHFYGIKYLKFLKSLENLCISNCNSLNDLTTAPYAYNRLSILLSETHNIKIDHLHKFANLQELSVFNSSNISLSDSENIESVRSLEISDCEKVDITINFKSLSNLTTLYLFNTTGSITFKNIEYAKHLEKLRIHNAAITNPESLERLPHSNPQEEEVFRTPLVEIVQGGIHANYVTNKGNLTSLT